MNPLKIKKYFPIGILVVLCFIAYGFSLGAILRGESWVYQTVITGNIMPIGDNTLFRPIVVFVDWVEYSIFGVNPIGWRIISLIFHVAVVLSLFRLLKDIKNNQIAVLLPAFFAVSPLIINQILYVIIAPYMLFMVFLLNALYYLRKNKYIASIILLFISSFIYEQGFIMASLIGIWLLFKRVRKWAIPYFGISIIYASIFIWTVYQSSNLFLGGIPINSLPSNILDGLQNSLEAVSFWLCGSVIHYVKLIPTPNLIYDSVGFTSKLGVFDCILLFVSVVVVLFCIYKMKKEYHGSVSNENNSFMVLIAIMAIVYVLVISIVRANIGINYILDTNQSSYMFGIFMTIMVYIMLVKYSFDKKWIKEPLIVFILIGLISVANVNSQIAQNDKMVLNMINKVDSFVNTHNDDGFTFDLKTTDTIENYYDIRLQNNGIGIAQIIWDKYYNTDNPTYHLYYDGSDLIEMQNK